MTDPPASIAERTAHAQGLRLAPPWVRAEREARGFVVRENVGLSGMVRLVATRGRENGAVP